MMQYKVKQLAEKAGISVRTLQYYDQIGLLKPGIRTENNYRLYQHEELLKLQQILFYRELGFELKEIINIVNDPNFDIAAALSGHKKSLQLRKKEITQLIKTVDVTIEKLKKEDIMKADDLYKGFSKGKEYRKEAIQKFGKETIEHSEEKLAKLGKKGFEKLKMDFDETWKKLFELRNEDPSSLKVQLETQKHYEFIGQFWGKGPTKEAYLGLADTYINDDRFLTFDGKIYPEFGAFLKKAMGHYASISL